MRALFDGFMAFGGTEIVNVARTWAYVQQAMPTFGLADCYGCREDLRAALGHEKYESVLVDQPDWFDPRNPDSWRFYGLWPLAVDGFEDAVREASVTQLMTDGAAITAPRQQGREMTVSALLIGGDDAAISYGLSWLRFALFGAACRDSLSCTGDHLCWFSACPPMCEDSPDWPGQDEQIMLCEEGLVTSSARACTLPYERTFYDVTVIEGPKIADRYDTVCGSMVRVEWTMVAAVPWAYSTGLVTASTQDAPVQIIPNIDCTAGTSVVRRTNRFWNPIPLNTGGWNAHGTSATATRDATVSRLDGRTSVLTTVVTPQASPNLATNPLPTGNLDGWSFRTPQDSFTRTNLATNPQPLEAGGGTWEITGLDPAPALEWHDTEQGAVWGPGFVRLVPDVAAAATDAAVLRVSTTDTPRAGTYTASVYVRPSADVVVDTALEGGGVSQEGLYLRAGQWNRVWATGVLDPATSPQVVLAVTFRDPLGATTLDLSGLLVETGSNLNAYFDGWTPGSGPEQVNTWDGQEGASTSTQTWPASSVTTTLAGTDGPNGATSYQHNVVTVPQVRGGGGPGYVLARDVAVGDVYTVSLWVRASGATQVMLSVQGVAADGTVTFTQSADPITTPVGAWTLLGPMTVVATAAAAKLVVRAVQAAGPVPQVRTNLAVDPEMADSQPSAWTPAGTDPAGAGSRVTGADDGPLDWVTSYGRYTVTGGTVTGARATVATVAVTGGSSYTVSAFGRLSVQGDAERVAVDFLDSSGTLLATVAGADTVTAGGVWSRVWGTFAAPVGAASMVVYWEADAALGAGETADVTGLLVEASTTLVDYFSGSTPSTFDWEYRWTGTSTRSTSTARSLAAGALPAGGSLDAGSVQILAGQADTMPLLGQVDHIGQTDTTNTQLKVSAGVTYTASLYIRPSRLATGRVSAIWYNSAGTAISTSYGSWTPLAANSWTRVHVTGQAPATAVSVHVFSTVNAVGVGQDAGARVGDKVWWGDALLEQSPSVLTYFDGSMPDVGTSTVYAWTGTANASTSTLSSLIPAQSFPVLDPDCAVVPAPPRPDPVDVSCLDTPSQWIRYDALIPAAEIPVWRDAVPVVRITTEALAARQIRVRFYPNEFSAPIEGLDQCEFCGEFVVSYVPPNSTLTIDGIRRTAYVTGKNTSARQTATHLLYASDGGPMTWPELTCGLAYSVTLDVSPSSVVGLSADACVAARE